MEAFPAYTFEMIGDLSREDWLFLYAKARTTLEHIRRDAVLNQQGLPLTAPNDMSITIDKYPHLKEYGLFGEQPPENRAPQQQKEEQIEYKIDPRTGNPISTSQQQAPIQPEKDDNMFSSIKFNQGMSNKSR